jgi:hypothetical protein
VRHDLAVAQQLCGMDVMTRDAAKVERGELFVFDEAIVSAVAESIRTSSPQEAYKFPVTVEALEQLKNLLPKKIALVESPGSDFDKTISIRRLLATEELWKEKSNRDALASWIVRDWGGVRRGKKADEEDSGEEISEKKLERILDKADKYHQNGKSRMSDVASWSKYLAFRYPAHHAIYDARTAYALNWLLWTAQAKLFFPFPPGRNSLLIALDYRLWLAAAVLSREVVEARLEKDIQSRESDGGKSSFVSDCLSDFTIDGRRYYAVYCDLLRQIARKVYGNDDEWGLTKVEMTLFALATTSVLREVFSVLVPNISTDAHA